MKKKKTISLFLILCFFSSIVSTPFLIADNLKLGRYDLDLTVKKLADGVTLDNAKNVTANNGIDEIFLQDESGKLYVAYSDKLIVDHLKNGFIGLYNGKKVKVVHFEDERNTFSQGAGGFIKDTGKKVGEIMSNTVVQAITGAVGSISGAFIAMAMFKGTAAATAATAGATGAAAAASGGGLMAALSPILMGAGIMAGGIIAIVGAVALIKGISASRKFKDVSTIDMITDQNFAFQDKKGEGFLEGNTGNNTVRTSKDVLDSLNSSIVTKLQSESTNTTESTDNTLRDPIQIRRKIDAYNSQINVLIRENKFDEAKEISLKIKELQKILAGLN
ncbi:hypothetical protein KAJ27_21540 [bacterium]|nr:hypothetical protein [bacterium]